RTCTRLSSRERFMPCPAKTAQIGTFFGNVPFVPNSAVKEVVAASYVRHIQRHTCAARVVLGRNSQNHRGLGSAHPRREDSDVSRTAKMNCDVLAQTGLESVPFMRDV